jgi:hypothetical protein
VSSSIRRGTLAATALALAVASLSACAAGSDAQSLQIKPDNAAKTVEDLKIQNVNVVTPEAGEGPAAVTGRIFNQGRKDEVLTAVTVKGAGQTVKLTPAKGEEKLIVPAGGSLALGGHDNAEALLPAEGAKNVRNGDAQPVTFELSRTGKVTLKATVVPADGQYKDFGPTFTPSPGASTSPSGSPDEHASPGASESPSGEASEPGEAEEAEADGHEHGEAGHGEHAGH